jgi:hypothetical protein
MQRIEPLAEAALSRDHLKLRSLAQELVRTSSHLGLIPRPDTDDPYLLALAAGLLELLAIRTGQQAPAWTSEVGSSPEPFFLLQSAAQMKRLRELCHRESPEPLRKRSLYAPPNFLSFV